MNWISMGLTCAVIALGVSDEPTVREQIAAEATANKEMIIFADLDLEALDKARKEGTVRNLNDRRPDVYSVDWKT